MKGIFDVPGTMIGVIIFTIGTFLLVAIFIAQIADFHAGITKPGINRINTVDATHLLADCLDKVPIEEIIEKIEECKSKVAVKYIELVDIETGNKWTRGSQGDGTDHNVAILLGNDHIGRLYVEV